MAWELEWGGKLEFLKTLQQQGHQPDALRNPPRLKPWVVEYHRGFQILSASRPMGMGAVGPIPLSEIAAYLDLFEVCDLDAREDWITMIQALDSVYLKHVNKQKPEAKGSVPKRKR